MKTLLLALLKFYRYAISPMLGSNCRFVPSCSEYAVDAVSRYGALRCSWLAAKRAGARAGGGCAPDPPAEWPCVPG